MNRSAGVTFAAVVSLLGSLATLALGLLMVVVALFARHTASPAPGGAVMALSSVILILPAALGIATSIGLFLLKRWARISILIFACLLTLMGVSTPLLFLAVPMPSVPGQNPEIWTYTRVAMSVFYLFLAAIGVWWLIFFNLKVIKEQFTGGQPTASVSERPLSITVIGWLLILACLTIPFSLLLHLPAAVLGHLFTGWAAILWNLALAGVSFYSGVGLLRLDPRCRQLAIGYLTFGAVNGALFYLLPGSAERMAASMSSMPAVFRPRQNQPVPILNPWFFAIFISVLLVAQLYFLVTRRSAFYKPATPDSMLSSGLP